MTTQLRKADNKVLEKLRYNSQVREFSVGRVIDGKINEDWIVVKAANVVEAIQEAKKQFPDTPCDSYEVNEDFF